MLIVKRPFRNFGVRYTAGTVITDPAAIKRLKGRIAEGKIIEVNEQALEATREYFKTKYGVDILVSENAKDAKEPEGNKEVTATEKAEATKETTKKVVAKTATKVVAK